MTEIRRWRKVYVREIKWDEKEFDIGHMQQWILKIGEGKKRRRVKVAFNCAEIKVGSWLLILTQWLESFSTWIRWHWLIWPDFIIWFQSPSRVQKCVCSYTGSMNFYWTVGLSLCKVHLITKHSEPETGKSQERHTHTHTEEKESQRTVLDSRSFRGMARGEWNDEGPGGTKAKHKLVRASRACQSDNSNDIII